MDGTAQERTLARHLDDLGYAVMRSPASGSATDREQPDLLYGRQGKINHAMELKTTSKNIAYYDREEVASLRKFAGVMGAKPVLGARFKGDTTIYAYEIDRARRTESGKYAIDQGLEPDHEYHP